MINNLQNDHKLTFEDEHLLYSVLFASSFFQFLGTPLVHSNRPRRVKMRCGSKRDSVLEYIYI